MELGRGREERRERGRGGGGGGGGGELTMHKLEFTQVYIRTTLSIGV